MRIPGTVSVPIAAGLIQMVMMVGKVSKTQGLRKARMKASVAVTTGGVVVMIPVMAMGAPMVLVQKLVSSPHPVWFALCCNPAYTNGVLRLSFAFLSFGPALT